MPTSHARLYETEEQAREALSKLLDAGFSSNSVALVTPDEGDIKGAVKLGLPDRDAPAYAKRVADDGRSLLVVSAGFGRAQDATSILDGCDPVDDDLQLSDRMPNRSTPFSEFLGLPVLTDRRTFMRGLWGD